jgi:CHRD domain
MRRVFVFVFALVVAALVTLPALGGPPAQRNFQAHLSGDNEVPVVDTNAQGQATFKISEDEESLSFTLITANIVDVAQAHIHCGAAGVNGPVVVFLYPDAPPPILIPGRSQGVLNEGTATAANLIPRASSAECPGGIANFDQLIAKMRAGETYTNVHTMANQGGEIRGQNR